MAENSSRFAFSWVGVGATGWADGDALSLEYTEDQASNVSGVRGEGSPVYGNSRAASITVRLWSESPTNVEWSALNRALVSGEIADVPTFIYKKRINGVVKNYTGTCVLQRKPGDTANRDKSVTEWVFISSDCEDIFTNE